MNKVTVRIQGIEYTLVGEESEEHIHQVGETVDDLLSGMLKSNRKLNISTAAILTACNLVDEKLKLQAQIDAFDEKELALVREMQDIKSHTLELEAQLQDHEAAMAKSVEEESKHLMSKDEEIKKLQTEMTLMQESVREYRDDNEQLSKLNKELKFELQSYKYKVLDLQNKLFENQLIPSRDKKDETAKPVK